MAIAFACECGAAFDVPDDLAGLHAPCPNCHAPLVVPTVDDEVVDDVEVIDEPTPYRFADGAPIPLVDDAPPLRLPPAAAETKVDDEPEVVGDADPVEADEEPEPDDDASPEYF